MSKKTSDRSVEPGRRISPAGWWSVRAWALIGFLSIVGGGLVLVSVAYRTAPVAAAVGDQRLEHLPAPEGMPSQARAELKGRMSRHGNTMSNLVRAVVLLDRRTVQILAGRIADEEIIARQAASAGGRDRFGLSETFYLSQGELRAAAQKLAAAALQRGDDTALANHFGAVTRTCVTCHSAYLRAGLPPAGPASGSPSPRP